MHRPPQLGCDLIDGLDQRGTLAVVLPGQQKPALQEQFTETGIQFEIGDIVIERIKSRAEEGTGLDLLEASEPEQNQIVVVGYKPVIEQSNRKLLCKLLSFVDLIKGLFGITGKGVYLCKGDMCIDVLKIPPSRHSPLSLHERSVLQIRSLRGFSRSLRDR